MATLFDRGSRRRSRTRSAIAILPTALVALVGEENLNRGAERARRWMMANVVRSLRETRTTVKPLRKAAKRELSKTEELSNIVPFYPAIPLIPFALIAGLTTFSTLMAVRVSRHDRQIVARLDAIEAELARLREQKEWQAPTGTESKPAQLPWS